MESLNPWTWMSPPEKSVYLEEKRGLAWAKRKATI